MAESVEITSRHCRSKFTFCKRIQEGRSSVAAAAVSSLHCAGTVVKIRGLFHNTPVRRRHLSPSLELEKLRNSLNKILLVLHHVSLSLHDSEAGSRLLNVPRASSLLSRHNQLFGTRFTIHQEHLEQQQQQEGVKISALFSLQPPSRNALQLIYVNRVIVVPEEPLHQIVRNLLCPVVQRNGEQNPKINTFYVIVIECGCVKRGSSSEVDPKKAQVFLAEERRVRRAVTSIVASFLSRHGLDISHCYPPPPPPPVLPLNSSLSSSSRPSTGDTSVTKSSLFYHSPPPLPNPPTPISNHWRVMSNPGTLQRLKVHPLSGSSLTPRTTSTEEKERKYQCVLLQSNPSEQKLKKSWASDQRPVYSSRAVVPDWINPTFTAGEVVHTYSADSK